MATCSTVIFWIVSGSFSRGNTSPMHGSHCSIYSYICMHDSLLKYDQFQFDIKCQEPLRQGHPSIKARIEFPDGGHYRGISLYNNYSVFAVYIIRIRNYTPSANIIDKLASYSYNDYRCKEGIRKHWDVCFDQSHHQHT